MPAAALLADAAAAGAAAKQVEQDIQAYQKARNTFVNVVKARASETCASRVQRYAHQPAHSTSASQLAEGLGARRNTCLRMTAASRWTPSYAATSWRCCAAR